jgi:hypothetical protein
LNVVGADDGVENPDEEGIRGLKASTGGAEFGGGIGRGRVCCIASLILLPVNPFPSGGIPEDMIAEKEIENGFSNWIPSLGIERTRRCTSSSERGNDGGMVDCWGECGRIILLMDALPTAGEPGLGGVPGRDWLSEGECGREGEDGAMDRLR